MPKRIAAKAQFIYNGDMHKRMRAEGAANEKDQGYFPGGKQL